MKRQQLTASEIAEKLSALNTGGGDWALLEGKQQKLQKIFQFADFVTAFAFMTRCALIAERMNHHPEWYNVYRTVRVELTTHDAEGLTNLDFELAQAMNFAAGTAAG